MNDRQIYYLGGSPCAGKSTVAEILVARYGLNYIRLDDYFDDHLQSASSDKHPILVKIRDATCDEIWLINPRLQTRREIMAYVEEYSLYQAELEQANQPLLVEGAALLPCLVAPLLSSKRQAFFIVPSSQFQRKHYSQRTWVADVLRDCSDPDQAFENWMQRDETFARWVRHNALIHGLQTLVVDGKHNIESTAQIVSQHFGLP